MKYCLYSDEDPFEYDRMCQALDDNLFAFEASQAPTNDLGCAPFDFFCARHDDMLVTPERCNEGVFSTWVTGGE